MIAKFTIIFKSFLFTRLSADDRYDAQPYNYIIFEAEK